MGQITIADQIGCVAREIIMREKTYRRWVLKGKMTQAAADLELARMEAVKETLKKASGLLAEREPGTLATGEAFGPAKVRQAERERVLALIKPLVSDDVYGTLMRTL